MRYLTLSFSLLFLAACGKHVHPPTNICGTVEGYEWTDVNGFVVARDTADWKTVDSWCPTVEAYFADRPPVAVIDQPLSSLHVVCFPNPAVGSFFLSFQRDDTSYVDLRFVDADFQLLSEVDSITSPMIMAQAQPLGDPGELVRVYYRVVHPDGTAHRGHGDIKLGP